MATRPSEKLTTAARLVATTGSTSHVNKVAWALQNHDRYTSVARAATLSALTGQALRPTVTDLLDHWSNEPDVPGTILGGMLLGATAVASHLRSTQATEIVWTGPATAEVPVRKSREVLLQVIASAATKLTLVSFAAYKVPDIVSALLDAAHRHVEIRLVLETAESGKLKGDAANAFADLQGHATFYQWPIDERAGNQSTMHAKAAIADDHTALVTSANLTGAAIDTNIELGLLHRGGPIPRHLQRHFDALIERGTLVNKSQ